MPKLDTTIDNLELKSNKVLGDVPSADWTDNQYPSAKTLYNTYNNLIDLMHPIGSILCVGENTNPANTLGGVWELVDKEFEFKTEKLTDDIITDTHFSVLGRDYVYPRHLESSSDCTVGFSGHTVTISIVASVIQPEPGDFLDILKDDATAMLGTLDYSRIGLPSTVNTIKPIEIAINDSGAHTACCIITQNGLISATGAMDTSEQALICFNDHLVLGYEDMPDELCNKFYFKRIA